MQNHIREKREASGLSVADFAREMSVTTVTVWRWEKGELNVSLDTLTRMARMLQTTPYALVPDLGNSPPPVEEEAPSHA